MALAAALAIQQFQTAVLIVFFVLIAEALEHLTVSQGRSAIRMVTGLLPDQVSILDGGDSATRQIQRSDVRVGDRLLIRPGERLPVDGSVLSGSSAVDQRLYRCSAVSMNCMS